MLDTTEQLNNNNNNVRYTETKTQRHYMFKVPFKSHHKRNVVESLAFSSIVKKLVEQRPCIF